MRQVKLPSLMAQLPELVLIITIELRVAYCVDMRLGFCAVISCAE